MPSRAAEQDLKRLLTRTGALQALEFLERSREIAQEPVTSAPRPTEPLHRTIVQARAS